MNALRFPSWRWDDRSHTASHPTAPAGLQRAYCNDLYAVQVYEQECAWGTVTHLLITRHPGADDRRPRSWSDLQRIKNELAGPERVAVEVFPAQSQLIDQADVYHLWVLPDGMQLPFSLQRWQDTCREAKAAR